MHPRFSLCTWLVILLLLLPASAGAQGLAPQSPDALPGVSLTRSAPTVQGCNFVTVDIWINEVTSLYGADVRIRFDPALVQVVDQESAAAGTQIQPFNDFLKTDWVIRKNACNALDPADELCNDPAEVGTIWYAATALNPTPPVSGSGAIARITFRAVSAGVSPLTITYTKLSDREGVQIENIETDGDLDALPLAAPVVTITKESAEAIHLNWPRVTDAGNYRVYRAVEPYFTPAEPFFGQTTGRIYGDDEALGSTAQEYYYVVRAACPDGFPGGDSNRTGAFDFDLVAGQPGF